MKSLLISTTLATLLMANAGLADHQGTSMHHPMKKMLMTELMKNGKDVTNNLGSMKTLMNGAMIRVMPGKNKWILTTDFENGKFMTTMQSAKGEHKFGGQYKAMALGKNVIVVQGSGSNNGVTYTMRTLYVAMDGKPGMYNTFSKVTKMMPDGGSAMIRARGVSQLMLKKS